MPQLKNFTPPLWASELDDVYVAATDDVAVRIRIDDADGVTRYDNTATYTPVDGVVRFGELSKLVNQAILLSQEMKGGISTAESLRKPYADITFSFPETSQSFTGRVYYYSGYYREGVGDMNEFPMQIDHARVTPNQKFWVWVPKMGNVTRRVSARVVYTYDGSRQEATIDIASYSTGSGYQLLDASMNALFSSRISPRVWKNCKVHSYDIILRTAGEQTDQIHVTVDHNHYYTETPFAFINSFGLPEIYVFRGIDEEEHEMDADFGQCEWRYTRLDAEFWLEHKTNSGWISREEKATVLEVHRSPEVNLFADYRMMVPVTITDIDAKFRKSKTAPESITLTWRIADKRDIYEVDTATSMAGHGTFDGTFSLPFD